MAQGHTAGVDVGPLVSWLVTRGLSFLEALVLRSICLSRRSPARALPNLPGFLASEQVTAAKINRGERKRETFMVDEKSNTKIILCVDVFFFSSFPSYLFSAIGDYAFFSEWKGIMV